MVESSDSDSDSNRVGVGVGGGLDDEMIGRGGNWATCQVRPTH